MNGTGKTSFYQNAGIRKHLDAFSLINIPGRVYDPVIGYFTTPDDFVHNLIYYNNYEINTNYSYTTSPDPVQNVDATEAMNKARGEKGNPPGGDDALIEIELNITIGAEFSQIINIFGFGEALEINVISLDYMTFKWNSNMDGIQYMQYRTATSSFRGGIFGLYVGIKQDWGKMQLSPYGQLGLLYLERVSPARFKIIDVGNMLLFGYEFKVTLSPNKVINSYIKYQSEWNDKVGWSINPFLH